MFKLKISTLVITELPLLRHVMSIFKKAQLRSQSDRPQKMNFNGTRTHSISNVSGYWAAVLLANIPICSEIIYDKYVF